MKLKLAAGTSGVQLAIGVSNKAGDPMVGLTHATSGLVAEYRRSNQSSWTAFALVAGTLGTWSSGGFVADGADPGAYELDPPDLAFAPGAPRVYVRLRGPGLRTVRAEVELDAVNYQDANGFGLGHLATLISRLTNQRATNLDNLTAIPPTLIEIRAGITADHGDGSYLRNTEPPSIAGLATEANATNNKDALAAAVAALPNADAIAVATLKKRFQSLDLVAADRDTLAGAGLAQTRFRRINATTVRIYVDADTPLFDIAVVADPLLDPIKEAG
jgi:hypothetical protein